MQGAMDADSREIWWGICGEKIEDRASEVAADMEMTSAPSLFLGSLSKLIVFVIGRDFSRVRSGPFEEEVQFRGAFWSFMSQEAFRGRLIQR